MEYKTICHNACGEKLSSIYGISMGSMKNSIIFLLSLVITSSVALAISVEDNQNNSTEIAWLHATSLVDKELCAPAPTLYRGSHGIFFKITQAIRNMLGDTVAEYPAWGTSHILKNNFNDRISIDGWKKIKDLALQSLFKDMQNYNKRCGIADTWALETVATFDPSEDIDKKVRSLGIATTPDYQEAASYLYTGLFKDYVLIQINEKVPRAGKALMFSQNGPDEFYIPIVIPAQDISGAWTAIYSVEKVEKKDQPLQIIIRRNPNGKLPTNPIFKGQIVGIISQCKSGGCSKLDWRMFSSDFKEIAQLFPFQANLGKFELRIPTHN